jgi:hypothetical protein
MKRVDIIEKLLKEGFTEKTLSRMSDKNLMTISKTVLKEQFSSPSNENSGGYTLIWLPKGGVFREFINDAATPEEAYDKFMRIFYEKYRKGGIYDEGEYTANEENFEKGNSDGYNYLHQRGCNGNVFYFNGKLSGHEMLYFLSKIYGGWYKKGLEKINPDTFTFNLSEQVVQGSVVMKKDDAQQNPNKIQDLTKKGINVELREKKVIKGLPIKKKSDIDNKEEDLNEKHTFIEPIKPIKKISPIKVSKYSKGVRPIRPIKPIKPIKEDIEVEEWILNLAENNFSTLTSKKDIMGIINKNIQEASHNGIPEFMTYDAIKSGGAGSPQTEPGAPEPETIPDAPPAPNKEPRRTPYTPGPGPDHKPKAFKNKF